MVLAQLMAAALLLGLMGIWMDGHFPPWQEPLQGAQAVGSLRADLPGCRVLSPAELSGFGCTVISSPKSCAASPGLTTSALGAGQGAGPHGEVPLPPPQGHHGLDPAPAPASIILSFLFCKDMNQPFNETPLPLLAKGLKPKWFCFF